MEVPFDSLGMSVTKYLMFIPLSMALYIANVESFAPEKRTATSITINSCDTLKNLMCRNYWSRFFSSPKNVPSRR